MHWTNYWPEISAQMAKCRRILIATDFDGTLAPPADTPAQAVLPPETRTLLRRLAACPRVKLAIISGRALSDLQIRVGIPDLLYVGNQGLELSGPGMVMRSPYTSKAHLELDKAVRALVVRTAALSGVFVEYKGVSLAVHCRLASEGHREILREMMYSTVEEFPRLKLSGGKFVWELRPKDGWSKGEALVHLMTRLGLTQSETVCLGDDLCDEDAFLAARDAHTFRVGGAGEETAARYHLRDAADTQALLLCLLGIFSKPHTLDVPLEQSVRLPDWGTFESRAAWNENAA